MADKKRRYNVWETKNGHGELLLYFVTDRVNKDEDEEGYRTVAEFPISPRHDKDEPNSNPPQSLHPLLVLLKYNQSPIAL